MFQAITLHKSEDTKSLVSGAECQVQLGTPRLREFLLTSHFGCGLPAVLAPRLALDWPARVIPADCIKPADSEQTTLTQTAPPIMNPLVSSLWVVEWQDLAWVLQMAIRLLVAHTHIYSFITSVMLLYIWLKKNIRARAFQENKRNVDFGLKLKWPWDSQKSIDITLQHFR